MKKFLLTTIVFLGIGSVAMAQQAESAKVQTQKKSGIQKRADYTARILAAKKENKSKNETGLAAPVLSLIEKSYWVIKSSTQQFDFC